MLYEGAGAAMLAAEAATVNGQSALRLRTVTRALSILDALDGALDHGRGGTVARALAAAYAQVRALVVAANAELSPELFAAAAAQVAEVAGSWRAIRGEATIAAA